VRTADFNYDLPAELIAQHPREPRDSARLLVYGRKTDAIRHEQFTSLPEILSAGDVLVLNDSRVIPARLHAHKTTGGAVELLLVKRTGPASWQAMTRPGLRAGVALVVSDELSAVVQQVSPDGLRQVTFNCSGMALEQAIERLGELPIPPYIKEAPGDRNRYQTVYATDPGSIAAPTAGLHFTKNVLDDLERHGVQIERLTLHVGMGTFQPVKTDSLDRHRMHEEWFRLNQTTARRIAEARAQGRRIVAIGTTTVRALETASADGELRPYAGETTLFIKPGYRFRTVDAMLTNFHLPRSTLFVLVSAFLGMDQARRVYEEAVRHRYRFYSFGDCCLYL